MYHDEMPSMPSHPRAVIVAVVVPKQLSMMNNGHRARTAALFALHC